MLIHTQEHSTKDLESDGVRFEEQKITFYDNQKEDVFCLKVACEEGRYSLETKYYVGVDWVDRQCAVFVAPKVNKNADPTDFMKVLMSCMPLFNDKMKYTDLLQVKLDKPFIEIEKHQDLLSPLLIAYFLQLVKVIVKKGLRKSYYRIEKNLNARIKGKVSISKTLRKNIFTGNLLSNYCIYDEFGINSLENKIIKKTLLYIRKYASRSVFFNQDLGGALSFCLSALDSVEDDVDIKSLKAIKHNPFFAEYAEALELAKLILARYGYSESNPIHQKNNTVLVPPYWIYMPLLFELYVLGQLKQSFGEDVKFQAMGSFRWQPDFLLNNSQQKIIIDAKYKPSYTEGTQGHGDDIRQLSGYARDLKILSQLDLVVEQQHQAPVDCLIIYVDQSATEELPDNLLQNKIDDFINFYKLPIKLPTLSHET
jgi:5-methylcytosine-specific restriction enzyme subunit McrC